MKNLSLFSAILCITALLFATPVFAQKTHKVIKHNHKKTHVVHNSKTHKTHVVKHTTPKAKTHVVHNHNTHKTHVVRTVATGTRIKTLPVGYKRIAVGNAHYYHHLGNFYQWHPTWKTYVVVRPPLGAVINTVPTGYTVVRFNGLNHYVWNDVYYRPEVRNGVKVFVVARV